MNRQQRRSLEKRMKAASGGLRHAIPDSVTLHDGPMDGWVVKPEADALLPRWFQSWPASVVERWQPGRYDRNGREARWHVLTRDELSALQLELATEAARPPERLGMSPLGRLAKRLSR